MGVFDTDEGVANYISMAEGRDGAELIAELAPRLEAGARVLELGMGAGKDLELLAAAGFEPVGSDASEAFSRRYAKQGGRFEAHLLDAVTIETDDAFAAVYSNKVMHLLTRDQLRASLQRQVELLGSGGVFMHSFWYGQGSENYEGMLVTNHDESSLRDSTPEGAELLAMERYAEMEPGDSIWAIWRVR